MSENSNFPFGGARNNPGVLPEDVKKLYVKKDGVAHTIYDPLAGSDTDLNLTELAFTRLKDLLTVITDFRNGDVIGVDGPLGPAQMSKDDLLKVVAENGRNIVTMGRIGGSADVEAAFGNPASFDNAADNTIYAIAYHTGISDMPASVMGTLMTYTGNTATPNSSVQLYATNDNRYYYRHKWGGVWNPWVQFTTLGNKEVIHTMGRVGSLADAEAAFGNPPDLDNAGDNTVYAVAYITGVSNLPVANGGTLLTYTGNSDSPSSAAQIYIVGSTGKFFYRHKWGGTWGAWSDISQTFFTFNCNNEANTKAVLGATPSLNNAPVNSVITLSYITAVDDLPEAATGFIQTFSGDGTSRFQYYYVRSNQNIYSRAKWGSSPWTDWRRANETPIFGYINNLTAANKYLNNTDSVDNAPKNSVLGINWSAGIQGLPTEVDSKQGQLETVAGNLTGNACKQVFTSRLNQVWVRSNWNNVWTDWVLVSPAAKFTEVIATFEKIGACGGSFATGYSKYKDSSNVSHGVNMPENSWVQLWGRKHGITAKNFSSSGWSIKDWFASAANIAAVEANPCKVYFTLFGGGNDIEDYAGMTDLGSIADVHVGSEDTNPHTFYGDYSRLIAKLQTVGGWHTKVISFTYGQAFNAVKDATQLAYIQAIHDVQALYTNVYAIDLMDDAEMNAVKVSPYYYGGHYSAIGYKKLADRMEVLVDKLVNDNPTEFADIQWIGTNYDIAEWY